MEDETVTLRDRDTWEQLRVSIEGLTETLLRYYGDNNMDFKGLERAIGGLSIDGVSHRDRSHG